MSVHVSDRTQAFSEFERQAIKLTKYTRERLNPLPSRYRKFLNARIFDPTNRAECLLIEANEERGRSGSSVKRRETMFREAVKCYLKAQVPLLAIWNLRELDPESSKDWAERINLIIRLVWGAAKWEDEMPMIYPLPSKHKLEHIEFLKTMANLHRYTYQKIGHAPQYCKDAISDKIALFVDTALCEIVLANRKPPQTQREAEERSKHLKQAVQALNSLQRPLFALWLEDEFSEREMLEWAEYINSELRLLEGLKTSDEQRYAGLK